MKALKLACIRLFLKPEPLSMSGVLFKVLTDFQVGAVTR